MVDGLKSFGGDGALFACGLRSFWLKKINFGLKPFGE